MVMTNSTYDGLCYNVDAIKADARRCGRGAALRRGLVRLRELPRVLRRLSRRSRRRIPRARRTRSPSPRSPRTSCWPRLSQASMIHVQHAEKQQLDMARFNEAFMMHTSTSPQYGIIASCDVAAAMMEQPAGRALVQETIDEALSFRRAMTAVEKQLERLLVVRRLAARRDGGRSRRRQSALGAQARRPLARVRGTCREPCPGRPDQGHHPDARASPPTADAGARHSGRRGHASSCRPAASRSRRPASTPSSCCSRWASPRASGARSSPSSSTSRISTTRNAPLSRALPALAEAHPEAYAKHGAQGSLRADPRRSIARTMCRKAQRDMYTTLPEMAMRPADAYEHLVRGQRRERRDRRSHGPHARGDDRALSAGHSADHAGRAHHRGDASRSRTICSTRATSTGSSRASRPTSTACASSPATRDRRYLVDCVIDGGGPMIPRDVKAPTIADSVPQAAQGRRDRRSTTIRRPGSSSTTSRRENFEVEVSGQLRSGRLRGRLGRRLHRAGRRRAPRAGARRSARRSGTSAFSTPLWALADSHRISDMAVLGLTGEVDGYIYLGQQTPAFYAKQVVASLVELRHDPAAALLRRADGLRRRGQHRLRLPGTPGRPVLPQVARRAALLQAFRREHLPQRPLQRRRRPRRPADPRGRRPQRRRSMRRRCSAPTRPISS